MEIKDLAGLSQPLTKLLEVIEKGVGAISRPYLIRKTADAKAYELRTIAEAQAQTRGLLSQSEYVDGWISVRSMEQNTDAPALSERAEARTQFKELSAQANVEAVCAEAANAMSTDEAVPEVNVEPDWVTRFFRLAEEVNSEEMQQIWGRILAGEVRSPGSISLRTLEALRNISRVEAELFCRLGQLAIDANGKREPMVISPENFLKDIYGLSYQDILALRELGLVHSDQFLQWEIEPKGSGTMWFDYADHAIVMKWEKPTGKIGIPVMVLTKTGRELLPLVTVRFDQAYAEKFCSLLKRAGCTFLYGPITERLANGVSMAWSRPILDDPVQANPEAQPL